jgi:CRP/FNR family transcriptional regulator, cyclic AMP receptor protein
MPSDGGFWGLLSPAERDSLRSLGSERNYPPGVIMCVEGDPATHVFVLISGWVKVLSVTDDGHERVLALRGDGDVVGEAAGDTIGRRNATIQAISAVRALIVSHERFTSFLDTHHGPNNAYRRMMARRMSGADMALRRQSVTSGAQRLAGLLLDLAGQHGNHDDGVIEIALPLTQEELASLAGASRATITRALNNWRKRDLIRTGQRRITIIDPQGLRRTAGPAA